MNQASSGESRARSDLGKVQMDAPVVQMAENGSKRCLAKVRGGGGGTGSLLSFTFLMLPMGPGVLSLGQVSWLSGEGDGVAVTKLGGNSE